jgi:hypothetical protein
MAHGPSVDLLTPWSSARGKLPRVPLVGIDDAPRILVGVDASLDRYLMGYRS